MTTLRDRVEAWRESAESSVELQLLVRSRHEVDDEFVGAVEATGVDVEARIGSDTLRVSEVESSLEALESLDTVEHVEIESQGTIQEGNSPSLIGTVR